MSCYHPLNAFPVGYHEKTGRTAYKICGPEVLGLRWSGNSLVPCTDPHDVECADVKDFVRIPCHHCIGCRLDYSRAWADRLMIELQRHETAYFVTLTYDDDHLDPLRLVDLSTGEIGPFATLSKRDCQLFMKRLRKAHLKKYPDKKLMYYLAGEYGESTYRPHYHAIIFDLVLDDLQLWTRSKDFTYWTSDWLKEIWKNGRVIVAAVTWETCAYTARYIMKKQYGKKAVDEYEKNGLQREFTLISTKPAIAREYFFTKVLPTDQMKSRQNDVFIETAEGGKKVRLPRYYDRLYAEIDPAEMDLIKEERRADADIIQRLKLQRTSCSYLEMLSNEEINKSASIRQLRRSLK